MDTNIRTNAKVKSECGDRGYVAGSAAWTAGIKGRWSMHPPEAHRCHDRPSERRADFRQGVGHPRISSYRVAGGSGNRYRVRWWWPTPSLSNPISPTWSNLKNWLPSSNQSRAEGPEQPLQSLKEARPQQVDNT